MGSAREWMALGPSHALDFILVPSAWGTATSIGLGLALAQPDRRVIVCSGDGSLLMNLGSLASIVAASVREPRRDRIRQRGLRGDRAAADGWRVRGTRRESRRGLRRYRPRLRFRGSPPIHDVGVVGRIGAPSAGCTRPDVHCVGRGAGRRWRGTELTGSSSRAGARVYGGVGVRVTTLTPNPHLGSEL